MAHALEINANGQPVVFWVGDKPWWVHGDFIGTCGNDLPELTAVQAMERIGTDWTTRKVPLYANSGAKGRGKSILIPDHEALIRNDNDGFLTVVSGKWNDVDNLTAAEFTDHWIVESNSKLEVHASLGNGALVYFLVKLGDDLEIISGDSMKNYLLFSNYHQYGKATDIRLVNERVVCANTHAIAMRESATNFAKFTHARAFDPEAAKNALGLIQKKNQEYVDQCRFLASKKMTTERFSEFLQTLFPVTGKNLRQKEMSKPALKVLEILETQPGADLGRGTWWQGYNAVTYWGDHMAGHEEATRLYNAWYGRVADKKQEALTLALEMAA